MYNTTFDMHVHASTSMYDYSLRKEASKQEKSTYVTAKIAFYGQQKYDSIMIINVNNIVAKIQTICLLCETYSYDSNANKLTT